MKVPDLRTLNTLHSEKLLAFKMDPCSAGSTSDRHDMPPNNERLFSALTGISRPQMPPPNDVSSTMSPTSQHLHSGMSHAVIGGRFMLPAIQRPWEHMPHIVVPHPRSRKEGSLSPMDTDSSEGSQVSPTSVDSLRRFEIMQVHREGDISDFSDGHSSSEGRSPKNEELSESSDRERMELASISSGSHYDRAAESEHSDRESPKSTHSALSDSVIYKPHKKFRAHRISSDASESRSPIELSKQEAKTPDIPEGLILRSSFGNGASCPQISHVSQLASVVNRFPESKDRKPVRINVPRYPYPDTRRPWNSIVSSANATASMSGMPFMTQTVMGAAPTYPQFPAFYTPGMTRPVYPMTLQTPVISSRTTTERCEPLNLSTKSSDQHGVSSPTSLTSIPIKVERSSS